MSKLNILIVEDEPLIADDIAMILGKNNYEISGIEDNAVDAMEILASQKVDLVLLDINIEGDTDGIQLAHQINTTFNVPFIFLTSYYDNNTLKRAKGANPVGYIVKPFDEGDLVANIELAKFKTANKASTHRNEKFFIRNNNKLESINADDILYVESDDNYANIYTTSQKYVVPHTLKSVEAQLPSQHFTRIHKSYLINFTKISSIHEGFVFINSTKLSIGRAYKDQLLNSLSIL